MKGIETGLSQLIAKPLANLLEQQLTPGEGIGGVLGGAAQKALGLGVQAPQAAQFGLGMTSTDPFTGALTKATAVLESHAAATATDTSATTTGTSATLVDTGVTKGSSVATLVDTGVTKGSTVATLVDTGVTKSGTAADLLGMTVTQSQTAAILIDTTAVTANATAQSASTGGGILGLLSKIPLIGGLFPHFAAGGIVPGFAAGGIVPSAQGGMVAGGIGGTLALLHPREMVLPAHISEGVQSMIAGGRAGNVNSSNSNTANLNYSPTINTGSRGRAGTGMTRSEFSQLLSLHSGALLGEARNMTRSGWRPA